jgi:hypothetical protein
MSPMFIRALRRGVSAIAMAFVFIFLTLFIWIDPKNPKEDEFRDSV